VATDDEETPRAPSHCYVTDRTACPALWTALATTERFSSQLYTHKDGGDEEQ